MNVDTATQDDIAAICELADQINSIHHQALPALFVYPTDTKITKAFWAKQLTLENSAFLVAKVESRVVGFITARITESSEIPYLTKRKICRIGTIGVREDYQKRGVGGALMTNIEIWASERKAVEVRLEVMDFNVNAQSFYGKKGYETSSRIMAKTIS